MATERLPALPTSVGVNSPTVASDVDMDGEGEMGQLSGTAHPASARDGLLSAARKRSRAERPPPTSVGVRSSSTTVDSGVDMDVEGDIGQRSGTARPASARDRLLSAARKRGREAGELTESGLPMASAASSSVSTPMPTAAPVRQRGGRPSADALRDRRTSSNVINAALQGEDWQGNSHKCHSKLPCGRPCWSALWSTESDDGKEDLRKHLDWWTSLEEEERKSTLFARMQDWLVPPRGPSGEAVGKPQWHYYVRGRKVCSHVLLLQVNRRPPTLL